MKARVKAGLVFAILSLLHLYSPSAFGRQAGSLRITAELDPFNVLSFLESFQIGAVKVYAVRITIEQEQSGKFMMTEVIRGFTHLRLRLTVRHVPQWEFQSRSGIWHS